MATIDDGALDDRAVFAQLARMIRADDPQHLHDNADAWLTASQGLYERAAKLRAEADNLAAAWPDRTGTAIAAAMHSHAAGLEREGGKYEHNYQSVTSAAGALTEAQRRLDRIEATSTASTADRAAGAQNIIATLDGEYQVSHARMQDPVASADAGNDRRTVGDDEPSPSPEVPVLDHQETTSGTTVPARGIQGPGTGIPQTPTPGADSPPSPPTDKPRQPTNQHPPVTATTISDGSGSRPETGGLAGAGDGGLLGAGGSASSGNTGRGGFEPFEGTASRLPSTAGGTASGPAVGIPPTGAGMIGPGRVPTSGVPTSGSAGPGISRAGGASMPGVPGAGTGQKEQRRERRTDLVGDDDWLGLDDDSAAPWVIGGRRTATDLHDPAAHLWESHDNPFYQQDTDVTLDLGANAEYAVADPFDANWEVIDAEQPEPPERDEDRDWRTGLTAPELDTWSKAAGVELAPRPERD